MRTDLLFCLWCRMRCSGGAGVEEDSQPSGALERFKKRRTEG